MGLSASDAAPFAKASHRSERRDPAAQIARGIVVGVLASGSIWLLGAIIALSSGLI